MGAYNRCATRILARFDLIKIGFTTLPFKYILMKIYTTICCFLLFSTAVISQTLSGNDLLDKAIAYHDPYGGWPAFNGTLAISMVMPEGQARESNIRINLPEEYFNLTTKTETDTTWYSLTKKECTTSIKNMPVGAKRTPCETAVLYKDYYTYLYGLPMKLKDPGTIISKNVVTQNFKGKEYLMLRATYDKEVGSDVWQFYFDPTTYAMEVYQFFKADPGGAGKNTGEYILLKNIKTINGIKFPKERAWYYNKDDGYLGTDILN